MLRMNSACSAATGIVVYQIGKEVYNERAGWFAGWIWTFSPTIAILPFIQWDTSLSALALSMAVWLTLRLASRKSNGWAECGASWDVAALVNPALVAPLPLLAWMLSDRGRRWKQVALLLTVSAVVIVPWTARNYLSFANYCRFAATDWRRCISATAVSNFIPWGQAWSTSVWVKLRSQRTSTGKPWSMCELIRETSWTTRSTGRCCSGFIQ
jgi:hypothetical protein